MPRCAFVWRTLALAAGAGLLGACQQEPAFEERYEYATKRIEASSKAIDSQLAGSAPTVAPEHSKGLATAPIR
ncbi:hypothetical protein [Novosphingobium sp. BW1]|uniref:hypothetical protein n=1 Tax=Novosphingobium sp. BW1 TaxID=2592621 RepID=UPI0011DEF8C3|nr:hypothetical protein [Novosphingobium sp. BW1]TYC90774.1 hypothetical protein FMM79_05765 [Novosphingobium sp. BW1]